MSQLTYFLSIENVEIVEEIPDQTMVTGNYKVRTHKKDLVPVLLNINFDLITTIH